jgi:hypothetical protein
MFMHHHSMLPHRLFQPLCISNLILVQVGTKTENQKDSCGRQKYYLIISLILSIKFGKSKYGSNNFQS